jgi:lipid II:glycine glycyltransferase (peptidoglycan interpeptide bridge formation enzyme)
MNMLTLFLARYRNKVVAGIIVVWFKGIASYKFGASDERFMHHRANQLLMWHAIRLAQERGCRMFDFGRANCANKGLAQYKSRWGTVKVPFHYLQLPTLKKSEALIESSSRHSTLKKIIARTPKLVNRMSSELLYKHLA